MLSKSTEFSQIVKTTILAAVHVLILVISTDLGSALIYFMTYLIMLYVATRDWKWLALGFGAFVVAAVAAYFLFAHVRVRVEIWKDPFSVYEGSGYQVAQALFAIAAGGWFGTVCIRDHRPRSLMWIRTLCLRRSPKRWEVFSAFARF